MIRSALMLGVLTLAACAPAIPDSGEGVGFQSYKDYDGYRSERDTALNGTPASPSDARANVIATPIDTPSDLAASRGQSDADEEPHAAPTIVLNNPEISDEQNFAAVSERETIESDAERLRIQKEAYEVIQPTAVPTRSGAGGPNIVEFALASRNQVGEPLYRRSALTTEARYVRNCARYASPDLAQEDFLRAGGPERDRKGIDPDGDGFACSWDPGPFRLINASNG